VRPQHNLRSHHYYAPTMLDRLARRWEHAGPRWHLRIALAILLATFLATAVLDDPAFYDPAPIEQLP
jgi:Flp pilus assembly protein TadB